MTYIAHGDIDKSCQDGGSASKDSDTDASNEETTEVIGGMAGEACTEDVTGKEEDDYVALLIGIGIMLPIVGCGVWECLFLEAYKVIVELRYCKGT